MRFSRTWIVGGVIFVWLVVRNDEGSNGDGGVGPTYEPFPTYSAPSELTSYDPGYGNVGSAHDLGNPTYSVDSYGSDAINEDEGPEPVDVSYEVDTLRRAARDLESSASRFSDGSSNWRGVVPEVENDLYRTERRMRDLESALSTAEVPIGTQFDVDRIRTDVRDMRFNVDAMRSGVDWSGTGPSVQDAAISISQRTRSLETSVILEPPIRP